MKLLSILFGCRHRRTTFPQTPDRRPGALQRTYVVCLDCGKEFDYDWVNMRIGKSVELAPAPRMNRMNRWVFWTLFLLLSWFGRDGVR